MSAQSRSGLDWEGRTMLDRAGERIGTIEEIYLVEETGQPDWAVVRLGRLGKSRALVPLVGAEPVERGIRAAYEKDVIDDAPRIDGAAEPSEQQVDAVYRHYDIEFGGDGGDGARRRRAIRRAAGATAAHEAAQAAAPGGAGRTPARRSSAPSRSSRTTT